MRGARAILRSVLALEFLEQGSERGAGHSRQVRNEITCKFRRHSPLRYLVQITLNVKYEKVVISS